MDKLMARALRAYCLLLERRLAVAKDMIEVKNNVLAATDPALCLAFNHAASQQDGEVFDSTMRTCRTELANKWVELEDML